MSVDTTDTPARTKTPNRLTLRMAALLLGHGGVFTQSDASAYARGIRSANSRRMPRKIVNEAMRPLLADGVVLHDGDDWWAPNLADLAAWIADGFEAREDEDLDDPVIPGQRTEIEVQRGAAA